MKYLSPIERMQHWVDETLFDVFLGWLIGIVIFVCSITELPLNSWTRHKVWMDLLRFRRHSA